MEVAKSMTAALPKVLARALVSPPITLMLGYSIGMSYLEHLGLASQRSWLSLLSLPLFGTAGLFVVRDYLLVPLFLLPAILIGKLPQVPQFKADGIALVEKNCPYIERQPLKIMTDDGVELDAMLLKNLAVTAPLTKQRYVVWFNANGVLYEQNIHFAARYGEKLNAHVLLFNYRGVSESSGWPSESEHLGVDGSAMIQYVMSNFNATESQILLHGHSMGGGAITKVLAKFPKCYKIFDRTFWSLEGTAKYMIRPEQGLGKFMGFILFVYASTVIGAATTQMGQDVLGANLFNTLVRFNRLMVMGPLGLFFGGTSYMEHFVDPVISSIKWSIIGGQAWDDRCMTIYHKQDMVINYEAASMHNYLVQQGISPKAFQLNADPTKTMSHMYPLNTIEEEWVKVTADIDEWWAT